MVSPHTCFVGQLAHHGLYRDTCENLDNLDHSSITPVRLLPNRTTPVSQVSGDIVIESHRCDTGLTGMDYIMSRVSQAYCGVLQEYHLAY